MTKSYRIAHLNVSGQDMIIVPLNWASVSGLTNQQLYDGINQLQLCAQSAGLKGQVCIVWETAGRLSFMAPKPWHPFFASIDMTLIALNLNKTLTCDYPSYAPIPSDLPLVVLQTLSRSDDKPTKSEDAPTKKEGGQNERS